jgi:hypothetical protein
MNFEKTSKNSWYSWLTPVDTFGNFILKTICITISLSIANLVGIYVLKHYDASLAILIASMLASIGSGTIADIFTSASSQKTCSDEDDSAKKIV